MDIPLFFIHSTFERHLGCFQILAIMNKAVINICMRFLCRYTFSTHSGDNHFLFKTLVLPRLSWQASALFPLLLSLDPFPFPFAVASSPASLLNGGISQSSMLSIFMFSACHTFFRDGLFQDFSDHLTDVPPTCISVAGFSLAPQTYVCSLLHGCLLYSGVANTRGRKDV